MKSFYMEANRIISLLREAEYMIFDDKSDLIVNCIKEDQNSLLCKAFDKKVSTHNNDKLKSLINNVKSDNLYDLCERIKMNFQSEILKSINSYINISKISIEKMGIYYASVDFLFSNRNIRNKIMYTKIYKRIEEALVEAKLKGFHFEEYKKSDSGNIMVN